MDQTVFETWLKIRYAQKAGALFYAWTPHALHIAYDLRRIEEPAFNGFAMPSKKSDVRYDPEGCWRMLSPEEDEHWFSKSRVTCAWPEAKVYLAFAKSLAERLPKVAQFLHQVTFDDRMVSQWMYQIRHKNLHPDDVASLWVQQNPDVVQQWLTDITLEAHPASEAGR